jgi:hypothetical protein
MDVEPALLAEPSGDDADSLVSENDPDDLANEQTWPTEDEMRDVNEDANGVGSVPDATAGTTPKAVQRVPKGTSEYQATWILDDDEDEEENDEKEGEKKAEDGDMEMEEEMEDMPVEEETEMESRKSVAFHDLDMAEEEEQYVLFLTLKNILPHSCVADSRSGAAEPERKRKTRSSQTKLIPRGMSLHAHASNDIAACAHSGRALGTHTKTSHAITRVSSSLKILRGLSAVFDGGRSRRSMVLRYVYHQCFCAHAL